MPCVLSRLKLVTFCRTLAYLTWISSDLVSCKPELFLVSLRKLTLNTVIAKPQCAFIFGIVTVLNVAAPL